MIEIPENVVVKEWPASVTWYDQDRIFYPICKKEIKRAVKHVVNTIENLKKTVNKKKICMLAAVLQPVQLLYEIRNYAAQTLPGSINAIAMVPVLPWV